MMCYSFLMLLRCYAILLISVMICYMIDGCDDMLCMLVILMTGRGCMGHDYDWQGVYGSYAYSGVSRLIFLTGRGCMGQILYF